MKPLLIHFSLFLLLLSACSPEEKQDSLAKLYCNQSSVASTATCLCYRFEDKNIATMIYGSTLGTNFNSPGTYSLSNKTLTITIPPLNKKGKTLKDVISLRSFSTFTTKDGLAFKHEKSLPALCANKKVR